MRASIVRQVQIDEQLKQLSASHIRGPRVRESLLGYMSFN